MSEDRAPYGIPYRQRECIFCSEELTGRIVASNVTVYAIEDKYPVTSEHLLIILYRHAGDYFSLTSEEKRHAEELLCILKDKVLREDGKIVGFNIGMNCGVAAGQTVVHHISIWSLAEKVMLMVQRVV